MSQHFEMLHLHGFKCAGTTFAWILERNYGGQVAYVESEAGGDRLAWQRIAAEVDLTGKRAISSHLTTLPDESEGPARLNVAFVREPAARYRSAYEFQKRTGSSPHPDESFRAFLLRVRNSTLSNYQTRQLSSQDHGGWEARQGWQARPELIRLERRDFFLGVVERFDESLVVLEHRLRELGIAFDAAYARALNESEKKAATKEVPVDMTELDSVLWARADARLTAQLRSLGDADDRIQEFRTRCAALREQQLHIRVPGPGDWTYLPKAQAHGA